MSYPADFSLWSVIDLLWAVVNIGFFKVLLLNIPSIKGWSFEQLVIPLGLYNLLNAFIWGLFYPNMNEVVRGINRGDLDLVLTKPVSSQFMVSFKNVGISLFPSILTGIFLLWYGFSVNHIPIFKMIMIFPILISSIVIFYSLYFISVSFSFWVGRLSNAHELLPNAADTAKYPLEIFPAFIRFILTFIIPLGLLAIFPGKLLLSLVNPVYLLFPLFVAVFLLLLSHRFWNFALRHYSSASS